MSHPTSENGRDLSSTIEFQLRFRQADAGIGVERGSRDMGRRGVGAATANSLGPGDCAPRSLMIPSRPPVLGGCPAG